MDSFREIMEKSVDVSIVLANNQHYRAHIHPKKKAEQLSEHTQKIKDCAVILVEVHGLDEVINRLIHNIVGQTPVLGGNKRVEEWLKLLFSDVLVFHDFGKVNVNFQVMRMENFQFHPNKFTKLKPPFGHSFPGGYLYVVSHVDEIVKDQSLSEEQRQGLIVVAFFFSYIINLHHSAGLEQITDDSFLESFAAYSDELEDYLKLFGFVVNQPMMRAILKNISGIKKSFESRKMAQFPLFCLLKLNFSLLTAADYLATHEYMNDAPVTDWGVFNDRERVREMIGHFRNYAYNREIYAGLESFDFQHPVEKSAANLNQLRKEIAVELIQTIRKNKDKRLFYIEASTGSGKTNLSAIALTELMESDEKINKVFYVFPYTTLITQTYQVLKKSLGLTSAEIVELHSKAPLNSKSEEKGNEQCEDQKKDFIDYLFALYPVTVLSHVHFFDILKTNGKEANYLLHRLANSVVVIDEVQSYNPRLWDKMLYFISQYAEYFNIRFVLMSATLPKIGELTLGLPGQMQFVDLLPNAKRYLKNPNFAQRVKFRFDLFKQEINIETLARHLIQKSTNYKQFCSDHGTVHTIIEFIYKKTASEFFRTIDRMEHPFDDIFVLSGTILEPRRREIIQFIKNSNNRMRNILLITTQVVEAGVDIDMDLGYKNISLIDSDEQLAGRVNRNAIKGESEVYLFCLDEAGMLYKGDERYKVTRESIDRTVYEEILKEKDFSKLYDLVLGKIDRWNSSDLTQNFHTFITEEIEMLDYKSVDRNFQIINQRNVSVFVPLQIPLRVNAEIPGVRDELFTEHELSLLENFGVVPFDGNLDGCAVWQVYESMIEMRGKQFDLQEKVNFKMLQGIMSKFTFSLLYHSKDHQNILCGLGEEKYGYIYFSQWNNAGSYGEPYSYIGGLNSEAFKDIGFI